VSAGRAADPAPAEGLALVDYLRALRRRWRIVALATVVVTAAALAASLTSDKQYDATARLLFQRTNPVESLINPNGQSSSDAERDLNTQVDLIKLDSIAARVKREIAPPRTIHQLLDEVRTDTHTDSDIVDVIVRDHDRTLAAKIANSFANQYVAFRLAQARQSLTSAARLAEQQYNALSPADKASSQGQQLLARQRELAIDAALQTGGVQVVRRADPPSDASRPRPKLSGAIGLVLGLLLGAAAALALEFADRRLKDEDALERAFGLPILGAIPRPRRRGDRGDASQREAYGLLAANLRPDRDSDTARVVMVTSPAPSEGKTTATIGVARALARLGSRVIAIEADLRRPAFHAFSPALEESRGLTSILAGTGLLTREMVWVDSTTLESIDDEGFNGGLALGLIPAGVLPPNPQRLLSTPAMAQTIELARKLADVVLIDTPPVATVNDALALLGSVDDVVLVARLGATTKDTVRQTLRILHNLDAPLTGVVITDAPAVAGRYAYYGPPTGRRARADAERVPDDSATHA
jgi:tyrosine-protein kinase